MADYTPTNWVAYVTKVTADRLNNMEDGIQMALNAINDESYGWAQKCLKELDGTLETYKAVMRRYIRYFISDASDPDPDELTALCEDWYALTRPEWTGWVEFYQTDVSAVTTGTKGGDNADLTCTPSTDTVKNQDDYEGNPLFAWVDVNFVVDSDTLNPKITAIDGITNNFVRSNPTIFVGVMQMSGYTFDREDSDVYIRGYSANRNINYKTIAPLGSALNPDGTVREFVVHAKYMATIYNSAMTSCAGVIPRGFRSHNTTHTASAVNGSQYSGTTVTDDEFLKIMAMIKYGSLTLDGILQGCCNNSIQAYARVSESGTNRIIIPTGTAFEVGMGVLIGNYTSSGTDRGYLYSVSGNAGTTITAIETVTIDDTEYSAVYVDLDSFDSVANGSATVGTTYISTYHWPTGSTDGVLGSDGSPTSCTSGKYPARLQGIEFMNGGYELIADAILNYYQDADGVEWIEPYVCKTSAKQSTAITDDYVATGLICPQQTGDSAAWTYIKKMDHAENAYFPVEVGGSSTTYTRDALYRAAAGVSGARTWAARGHLSTGVAAAGLACATANTALSSSYWSYCSRLSANANRGEWQG